MTRKMIGLREEEDVLPGFQKCYELPDHTVQVRELSTGNDVHKSYHIGENKVVRVRYL